MLNLEKLPNPVLHDSWQNVRALAEDLYPSLRLSGSSVKLEISVLNSLRRHPAHFTVSNVRWRTDSIVAPRVSSLEPTPPLPVNSHFGSYGISTRFALCRK